MNKRNLTLALGLNFGLILGLIGCGNQPQGQERRDRPVSIDSPEFKQQSDDIVDAKVNTLDSKTLALVDPTKIDDAAAQVVADLKRPGSKLRLSQEQVDALAKEIPGYLRAVHKKDTKNAAAMLRKMAVIAYPNEASVKDGERKELGLFFGGIFAAGAALVGAHLNFIGAIAEAGATAIFGLAHASVNAAGAFFGTLWGYLE